MSGEKVPSFFYGTAWKKEQTAKLTELALKTGFRGIDTANQPKHYNEVGVGQGLKTFLKDSGTNRDEIFLQTKFTFPDGQDHRIPYDPKSDQRSQVFQSFESSLKNLQINYINSLVLHGPSSSLGLKEKDWQAWKAMEEIHSEGRVRLLGVSNVTRDQLAELYEGAKIKPSFVQSRCYASKGWNRAIRDFCVQANIVFQGFSLLTANREALKIKVIKKIAKHHGKTIPQIIFRFSLQKAMLPLTGTSNSKHMGQDLNIYEFELSEDELNKIENIA